MYVNDVLEIVCYTLSVTILPTNTLQLIKRSCIPQQIFLSPFIYLEIITGRLHSHKVNQLIDVLIISIVPIHNERIVVNNSYSL